MTTMAPPTQAERDLAQYRAGQISLDELATRWAKRKMGGKPPARPTKLTEVYEQADNKDYFEPGTWGEIRLMRLQRRLTAAEYKTVSQAADPPKPSSQLVRLFSTPTPPGVEITAPPESGSVTADGWDDAVHPRDDDGKFAPGDGSTDHGDQARGLPPVPPKINPLHSDSAGRWIGIKAADQPPHTSENLVFWDRKSFAYRDYQRESGNRSINDPLRDGSVRLPPPTNVVAQSVADLGEPPARPYAVPDPEGGPPTWKNNPDYTSLDDYAAAHTLENDSVVYRGLAVPDEHMDAIRQPGTRLTDYGYTSTTTDRVTAGRFAKLRATGSAPVLSEGTKFGGNPVVMEIHVPAGTHAFPGDSSVNELVLGRQTTMEVLGVRPNGVVVAKVVTP